MKTAIIIGAGFTRAMKNTASIKRRPPLDKDFFLIAEKIKPTLTRYIHQHLKASLGEFADLIVESLESAASYLFIKAKDAGSARAEEHKVYLSLLELLQ